MSDPFTLALTVAVNLASMALTAMQSHEGPRLQDLSVTVADYGTPIPYLMGRRRIECPVMHAEPLREEKTKNKTKGGKYTEYKYYGTWASLICGNETATFYRIWGDRHLLYDVDQPRLPRNGLPKLKLGEDIRYYRGTEDQLPDERIAARIAKDEGSADLTPAYRGTSYMMFEDIPLENFGNRLPQVSIEASTIGNNDGNPGSRLYDQFTADTDYPADFDNAPYTNDFIWHSEGGKYAFGPDSNSPNYLFSYETLSLVWAGNLSDHLGTFEIDDPEFGHFFGQFEGMAVDDEGSVWGDGTSGGLVEILPNDPFQTPPLFRGYITSGNQTFTQVHAYTMPDGNIKVLVLSNYPTNNGLAWLHDKGTFGLTKRDSLVEQGVKIWPRLSFQDDNGDIWLNGVLNNNTNQTKAYFWRLTDVTGASPYPEFQEVTLPTSVGNPQQTFRGFFHSGAFVGGWDSQTSNFYAVNTLIRVDLDGSGTYTTADVSEYLLAVAYQSNTASNDYLVMYPASAASANIYGSMVFFDPVTLELYTAYSSSQWGIPALTGQTDPDIGFEYYNHYLDAFVASDAFFPDGDTITSLFNIYYQLGGDLVLGDICERVAVQAGMGATDYDFTDLDQPIYGFSWVQGRAADIVAALVEVHDSEIRPNGFIQEGIKRGKPLAGPLITYDWMARRRGQDGRSEPLYKITALSESELPRRIMAVFSEIEHEQQPNTAVAQRNGPSVWTKREVPVDLTNYAESADTIQPLVERSLRRQWMDAVSAEFTLTPKHLGLIPGHVRNLGFEDNVTIRGKLQRLTIKANRSLFTRWVRDGAVPVAETDWETDEGSIVANLPDSPGAISTGRPPPTIYDPVESVGWVLDIPLLSDADDRTAPFVYFAGSPAEGTDEDGNEPDWPGLTFLASDDGEEETYENPWELVSSSSRATYGTTYNALGSALTTVIDNASQLVVELVVGQLESVSEAQLLADGTLNLALIGDELVQFRDAIIQSGGQYVLGGLIRGCRGTERHVGSHVAGERFLLCNNMLGIHSMGADEIGDTDYYKAVTNGFDPEEIDPFTLEFTAEAHRPRAPVHVTIERDGNDWIINAFRRSRIGGSSISGQNVPLGETSELYRIKFMGEYDVQATRDTSSLPFTYTEAMQIADWGSVQDDLTISICQMSPALSLEGHPTTASSD